MMKMVDEPDSDKTYAYLSIYLQRWLHEVIDENYPVARKVTTDTFFLGTSPVISIEQIDYIGYVLDRFLKTFSQ